MNEIPDPPKDIPSQLKSDTWAFHVLARSDDPAIKCLNIGNLVRNLKTAVQIAGLENVPFTDEQFGFETTLGKFLDYQIRGANNAWNKYTVGQTGWGVELANSVLGRVMFMIYDTRFAKPKDNEFVARK